MLKMGYFSKFSLLSLLLLIVFKLTSPLPTVPPRKLICPPMADTVKNLCKCAVYEVPAATWDDLLANKTTPRGQGKEQVVELFTHVICSNLNSQDQIREVLEPLSSSSSNSAATKNSVPDLRSIPIKFELRDSELTDCCDKIVGLDITYLTLYNSSASSSVWKKIFQILAPKLVSLEYYGGRQGDEPSRHITSDTLSTPFPELLNLVVVESTGAIEDIALGPMPKLKILRLDVINLTTLSADAFVNVNPNLVYLRLVTGLEGFPTPSVNHLTGLETLVYYSPKTVNLGKDPLSTFTKLTSLDLSGCPLTELKAGQLAGLDSLKYLFLRSNNITSVDEKTFGSTPRLKHLDMSFNGLKSLPAGTFDGLKKLKTLILYHNRLFSESMPSILEQVGKSLKVLNVGHNSLGPVFPTQLIAGLENLEVLIATSNGLSSLPQGTFDSLSNLRHLDLSVNELTELNEDMLKKASQFLTILDVSNNSLSQFSMKILTGAKNLLALNANHNNLTTLKDVNVLKQSRPAVPPFLELEGNPLVCDCNLYLFSKWIWEHEEKLKGTDKDDEESQLDDILCRHDSYKEPLKLIEYMKLPTTIKSCQA